MMLPKYSTRLVGLTLLWLAHVGTGQQCDAEAQAGCGGPPGNVVAVANGGASDEFFRNDSVSVGFAKCSTLFTNGCTSEVVDAFNDCFVAFFSSPAAIPVCTQFADQCCTPQTLDPTTSPSTSPTFAPSVSPTAPTKSPTSAPSSSPIREPSTSPTFTPSDAPTTLSPTASPRKSDDFFDDENNWYIVGGSAGGVLLLGAGFFLWRRSRDNDSGSVASVDALPSKTKNTGIPNGSDIFDWEKHIDKKSGEVYFFNPKTGESRWDPPEIEKIREDR